MSIKVGYNKGLYNKMVSNQESQGNARALGTALGALGGAYLANQRQQRRQQANAALAQEAGIPPQYAGMYDQGKLLQLIAERRRDEAMRENERYQQGEMMRRETTGNEAAMARLLAGQRGDLERARFGHESDSRLAQITAQRNMELEKLRAQGDVLQDYRKASLPMSPQDRALTEYRNAMAQKARAELAAGGDPLKQPTGVTPQTMEIASRIGLPGVGPGALGNLTLPQQQDLLAKRIGGQMSDADVYRLLSSFGQGVRGEQIGSIFGVPQDPRQTRLTDQLAERLNARGFSIPPRVGDPGTRDPIVTQGATPEDAMAGFRQRIQQMTPAQRREALELLNDDLISAGITEADQEP